MDYSQNMFKKLDKQHNIMVLVGNGFDIQVLKDYRQPVDSRYSSFYYHLKMRDFDSANRLLVHMEEALADGCENWGDIEAAVTAAVETGRHRAGEIFADLRAMQAQFAEFLQGVVPNRLLGDLGADAVANGWSMRSLAEFLHDIRDAQTFNSMQFPVNAGTHYGLFNFLFVNFNYTTLLDNYVFLDQLQFTPRKWSTVDTNFSFKNDPGGHLHPSNATDAGQSGYVLTDVVHPHGVLSTPRSLLLGIDAEDDYDKGQNPYNQLKKPYWAQSNVLFRSHFAQTELFIVFGCSLGESDGWWWRNIAQAVSSGNAEVIIYRRKEIGLTQQSVKDLFLRVAGFERPSEVRTELEKKLCVIIYEDSDDRVFLSTKRI
ncbi:AbiH family protein [Nocardioides sp. AX2bis]|uniref:AbiH family protein n=1 Tax=Nocardioides sp. AX2bis TaxID=2653157 RepID=UPI0012F456C7|nr:AbiH family protein [Nocardioides sp. AX2bis]VXB44425.1 conserved hypothetical protein [Nocardioides sp. AX2bis]